MGGLLGTISYGWLERHVRLGVIMRGGLIIETLTHLALALTRWAWFALIWRSLLQIGHADEQTRADAPPKGTDDGSTETGHCADAER